MHHYEFKMVALQQAFRLTFERRRTPWDKYALLGEDDFLESRRPEWATYVAKLKAATYMRRPRVVLPKRDFAVVMHEILGWLDPVMAQQPYEAWIPGKGWV